MITSTSVPLDIALRMLLNGAKTTIVLSVFSILLGLLIGLPVALMETYGGKTLRRVAMVYEGTLRGIPLLAIYFVIFYSMPMLIGLGLSPFLAAVVGLGIRSSAYQSQIFRSGIQAVDEGQIEAALSLGMSQWQIIRHIVLPQALRMSIPAWMNEYVIVLKDTSIALALGIVELTRQATYLVSITAEPFRYYGLAALFYLAMVLPLTYLANWMGKRYGIKGTGGAMDVRL
ncbi:Amino acid ABC transporter, permease protein [Thermococcus gammatolerans EJ3]|uniref:Amino acid ABC transporter, permease protein n=1 Tax=Thermococcus gammatolerans (strain DSM 15229 / JCM 11827 / EJ3) TaxID=593117 RepID=C5A2U2_THEGJ|nr:Amino acid ABC transporter, permease protein [Thermococcus gammatolerans EJ3]